MRDIEHTVDIQAPAAFIAVGIVAHFHLGWGASPQHPRLRRTTPRS
jgi:hypothetical protein